MRADGADLTIDELALSVRPTRALVQMRSTSNWHPTALRILESFSATWGGLGNAIATVNDEQRLTPGLLRAAELFDPDVWLRHQRTGRGAELEDPAWFEAQVAQLLASLAPAPSEVDNARKDIEQQIRTLPLSDLELDRELPAQVRTFRAPYWSPQLAHAGFVTDDELPSGLLVDRTGLSPAPIEVHVLDVSQYPSPIQVLAAMRWGRLAPSAYAKLSDSHVRVVEATVNGGDLDRMLGACWGARPDGSAVLQETERALGGTPGHRIDLATLERFSPFASSMVGCSTFQRVPPARDQPPIVVVGEAPEDMALAMLLDRSLGWCPWIPLSVMTPVRYKRLDLAIAERTRQRARHLPLVLTSESLDRETLEKFAANLSEHGFNRRRIELHETPELPALRPITVLYEDAYAWTEDEIITAGSTGRGLATRIPTNIQPAVATDLSWWTDVHRPTHQLPPRWPLNDHLVARSTSWRTRARVTTQGLAFHSMPMGFILAGVPLAQTVDRPRIRFPDVVETFQILGDHRGVTMRESAAGKFTRHAIDVWGGRTAIGDDLRHPDRRRILNGWLSGAQSGDDPGNRIGQRRYLTVDDMRRLSKPRSTDWWLVRRLGIHEKGLLSWDNDGV